MPKSQKPFENNSWYFRNSLVRANYTNMTKGIYMNTEYLEKFFRNMLLGESNELKNRYVHIHYSEQIEKGSVISSVKKEKSSVIILRILKENPELSAAEISRQLGISVRAGEKQFASLREKGKIKRVGPSNGGKWILISEDK